MTLRRPDPDASRLEAANWGLVGGTCLVVAVWLAATDMELAFRSAAYPAAASLAIAALGAFYRHVRRDDALGTTLLSLSQLIAFTTVGLPFSYLLASLGRPMWDAELHRLDLALGLDWRAYLAFVNDRPMLGGALNVAYGSIIPQLVAAVGALGLTGRRLALQRFAFAFIVSGLVTMVISGAMPAMAMFVHLGLGPADYPNLVPAAAHVHVADMEALRSGAMKVISLTGSEGIITFPSYHAALAAVFLAAFWSVPWLRPVGVALNLAMIAATPIDGGHYFVDVLAGILIAAASLAAAEAIAAPRRASARIAGPAPASA